MVSVHKVTTYEICHEGMNKPWVVKDVEHIDDVPYIKVSKDCAGFKRFAKPPGADSIRDNALLDRIKKLRDDASFGLSGTLVNRYQRDKAKKRVAMQSSEESKIIMICLPEVVSSLGSVLAAPMEMKVLRSPNVHSTLVIELSVKNLEYIKAAFESEVISQQRIRVKPDVCLGSDKQVRWNKVKGGYQAYRCHEAKATKFFKAHHGDWESARNLASSWINNDDEELEEMQHESEGEMDRVLQQMDSTEQLKQESDDNEGKMECLLQQMDSSDQEVASAIPQHAAACSHSNA